MNWQEYVAAAAKYAIYPGAGTGSGAAREYVTLGLWGEYGELCDHAKKILRDDSGELTDERREAMILELGDLCWYVARAETEGLARVDWSPGSRSSFDLIEAVIRAAEDVWWGIRGHELDLAMIRRVADELGVDLSAVLERNIAKLESRWQRGTIGGSGDKR